MRTKHANSGVQMGSLVGILLLFVVGTSCSVGGDDGSPSVITIESSDITPSPKSDDSGPSSQSNPAPAPSVPGTLESQEVTIAKCLSAKGAVLYGADWCPSTKQQIDSFKDGFQYLDYVECTEQGALCEETGIAGYPTWIIGEAHLAGYRSPTSIGASAGCSW